ncbi:MAG: cytochrome c3 family protein [Polyangiaceae bacterium]
MATRLAPLAVTAAMAVTAMGFGAGRPRAAPPMKGAPRVAPAVGYAGSGACASCHPGEHASWSRTYHRTMTQLASRGTVLAPLDAPVEAEGIRYVLSADRSGAVWEQAGDTDRERVLLTTGSHHMQGYWVAGRAGALRMLPFVFARDEQRIVLRREAFVEPPGSRQPDVRWGSNCIACHATAGEPRARPDGSGYDTRVTELGIACEACHGPGAAHVERYGDPVARYAQHRATTADPTIVNPARLPADRAAAVCGQCHAYAYPRDEDAFLSSGYVGTFRPGQTLDASRTVLSPEILSDPRGPRLDLPTRDLFWPDGTVRVAGREYSAMVLSACFVRGQGDRKLTCTSCHSMHASDPDDQLRRERPVQASCTSCHTMPSGHSHHTPGSAGDACVACHMPKTSYALRTAIRSHRVDSPDARVTDRPGACNLCHLDRSLGWTAKVLAAWRGESVPPDAGPRGELRDVPESIKGLLTRDAAERVLWADAMGDPDALAASGADWEGAALSYAAKQDPYAVVRFVAARSLRKLGGVAHRKAPAADASGTLLLPEDIAALARNRDDRDITVAE